MPTWPRLTLVRPWKTWSFDDLEQMKQVVEYLSIQMNRWHRRHNITYHDNQRIHEEVAQLIGATLQENLD